MRTIEFHHPHRRRHFEFFRKMDQPHFNITANVDATLLLDSVKTFPLPFTPTIVYLVSRAANAIPVFRQRIRGEQVVEHDIVHPSFTVATEVDAVFSFCEVVYQTDYAAFAAHARQRMEAMKTEPSMQDEAGRDDYLFLSAMPWISFTGVMHPLRYPADSVPRIVWGKTFEQEGRVRLPLSVQAHHALVDGIHAGQFFQHLQDLMDDVEGWRA